MDRRKPKLKIPTKMRRKEVAAPPAQQVRQEAPAEGRTLPVTFLPNAPGVDLIAWARDHREEIDQALLRHGAIRFRDFQLGPMEEFERFIEATSAQSAEYDEPTTPRTQVGGKLYTSTDYPPDQTIHMHNEKSNTRCWPMRIYFLCRTPSTTGGATPIADSRRVYQQMDPDIRQRFEDLGVLYIRNFSQGLGISWQTVFKTSDPSEVDSYCRENDIETEWLGENRLRLSYRRHGIAHHPKTGDPVWFNHCALFHASALDPKVLAALRQEFGEDELPYNTFFGDGSPMPPSVLEEIHRVYDEEIVANPWQTGDILLLDNMLTAHGRQPFSGDRRIVVGMADPLQASELIPAALFAN